MHTRVDSAMDVQVLNTIAMEATIMGAAHTQEATAIFNLNVKALLGHHASKVYISAISVIPLFKSFNSYVKHLGMLNIHMFSFESIFSLIWRG